jgi:uncharacterized protein
MKRAVVFLTLVAMLGAACDRGREAAPPVGTSAGSAAARAGSAATGSAGVPAPAPANDIWAQAKPNNAPRPAPLAHPLFWAVEKDGKTTYFLGTMHMGVDADSRLPPSIWDKFRAAPAFAMEADLDDPKLAEDLKKPTGASLHAQLGDADWKKLEDALGPGIANMFDQMPAMVPAAMLAMRGLPMTLPMDKALSMRATEQHKPIVFLEPAQRQLALLRKWMDVKALKLMLQQLDTAGERAQQMLAAYVAGDERKIAAMNDEERKDALAHGYTAAEYEQQMNEMLYDRNASWIAPIEQLHAQGNAFVAVGALHLIGPRSVLDLLARKGYRVTRVTP